MTLEEVICAETAAIAPAYPLILPADALDDAIVYQLIDEPELQAIGYVTPRVQLACWSKTYGAAVALANQVRSLFWGRHMTVSGLHYRSMVIDIADGNPDLDAGRYVRLVDVRFDYRNPV